MRGSPLLALLAYACASGAGLGDGGAARPLALATSACVTGWWFEVSGPPCKAAVCSASAPPPECAFTDCEFIGYYGYLPDGTLSEGQLSWSPSQQQFSGHGGVDDLRWAVLDVGIIANYYATEGDWGPNATVPEPTECSSNELVQDGYAPYRRQTPPISTALQVAFDDGGWQAVRY